MLRGNLFALTLMIPLGRRVLLTPIAFCVATLFVGNVQAESTEAGMAFFEKSIRPVLDKHCYECHSADAAAKGKLQAGLSLDNKHGLLTGGESGPAVIPNHPEKSRIIAALKYESYEMPPSGRLPAGVIEDFVKWVNMGAPDPRDTTAAPTPRRAAFKISAEDRQHWAFQPVANPPLPEVRDSAWPRDDADRFVLAQLERKELRPSAEADKHALLRRTTYALTGLPPTPDEIAAFVADDRSDAFERVVDRLLANPGFGVHWGRHWLDGVRYADNIDKSGEYRRWVVRSLNDDLPYDRFVKMQIAGDLYPADDSVPADSVHTSGASLDGVTATGMMALAVWEQVGRDLAVAEIVDSQIDLVGRQLLGLTLACARCHDHKFDPISAQDYYAMAGILFSSHIATGKLIADDRLGNDLIEVPLINAKQAAYNREVDGSVKEIETKIADIAKKIPQAFRLATVSDQLKDLGTQLAAAKTSTVKKSLTDQIGKLKPEQEKLLADQKENGWDENPAELQEIAALRKEIVELRKKKITGPVAVAMIEGGVPGSNRQKIGDAPVYLRGEYQRPGAIVPRRFPAILAGDQQTPIGDLTKQSGRKELAEWIASADNPLTARVMVNRIWQQMIGRGIVRSSDNFGRLGERPTHPELLDHLARRFVASGWSIKQMVREIALSSTFRQGSFTSPEVARTDPENLSISHMNRRRLTYEELRDSLLRLGNRLVEDSEASPGQLIDDTCRRTMFDPLDRRKTDVTATIFDGPDSKAIVPIRAETTSAPQALFMMNNPLTLDTAKRLATRLTNEQPEADHRQRMDRLWRLALGRPAEKEEADIALRFVAEHSWERLIQALLGTNEFVYLD